MPNADYMISQMGAVIASADEVALLTEAPSDSAGTDMVEVSGGSYTRAPVTMAVDPGDAALYANGGDLPFTNLPTCDVVAVALYSGGSFMRWDMLPSPKHFESGDDGTLLAGEYSVSLADG